MIEAIDFFCGAGGATHGLETSNHVKVVAAINHDPDAISCHKENHPDVAHFNYDIREVDEYLLARMFPKANAFWWSAECTHFSIAKGGGARDADSRMLNFELIRFTKAIMPDRIFIENVKEFRTWGPLDENGKPIKERQGEFYLKWIREMRDLGYDYDDRDLNAADYGARTSRIRLFGLFVKKGIPIRWPRKTHSKNPPSPTLMNPNPLKKWKPVRPLLDLDNWGHSIFHREEIGKRPLVKNTIKRIEYGLNKYFPSPDGEPYVLRYGNGEEAPEGSTLDKGMVDQFLVKYHGTGKNVLSIDDSASTITTKDRLGLVSAQYMIKQWSGEENSQGIDEPHHTITTIPRGQIVTTEFILPYNYNNNPQDVNEPIGTILSKRDKYLVLAQFLEKSYRTKYNVGSLDEPLGAITTNPKFRLVSGLLVDCRIANIYMRMLTVPELLAAQGFPPDYKMPGSATRAKKFIGNSVPPTICELLTHAQFGSEEQRVNGVREYENVA